MQNKLLLLLILTTTQLFGQKYYRLEFKNLQLNKSFQANIGDKISIQYKGYLNHIDYVYDMFVGCDDSSVFIGVLNPNPDSKRIQRLQSNGKAYIHQIRYSDIISFRRKTIGSELLRNLSISVTSIGTYLLLTQSSFFTEMSPGWRFGSIVALGLGIESLHQVLFNHKTKYKMKDGWIIIPHEF